MTEIKVDLKADLRGVSCPLNYVKTKLKLEDLDQGQVLAIWLDDGDSIVNVPRSAKEDGNEILEVNKLDGYYEVLIRKGKEGD